MRKYLYMMRADDGAGGDPTPPADPPKDPTPPADPPNDPTPSADPPKDTTPPVDPPKDQTPPTDPPKDTTPPAEPPKGPAPELISAELKAAAALAGVPKEALPYVVDLAAVAFKDAKGDTVEQRAEAAVAKLLKDIPALSGAPNGTGSLGDHRRQPAPPPTKPDNELSDKEYYAKHYPQKIK